MKKIPSRILTVKKYDMFEKFVLEVVVEFSLLQFCKILVQVNHTSHSAQDRCSCACNWRIGFLRINLVIFEIYKVVKPVQSKMAPCGPD